LFFVWDRGFPQRYSNMAVRKGPYKLVGHTAHGEPADLLQLYNLVEDPYELMDVSIGNSEVRDDLLKELDQWYKEIIVSPNLMEPPRITIGSDKENPVILGRNDWKGPKAMHWSSSEAFGYWDIKIEDRGPYAVKMVFNEPFSGPGRAFVRAGTRQYWINNSDTSRNEITIADVELNKGAQAFEGWYNFRGNLCSPFYIEIRKN
jgi:arylsulfatase